jgi:hypothetical protein
MIWAIENFPSITRRSRLQKICPTPTASPLQAKYSWNFCSRSLFGQIYVPHNQNFEIWYPKGIHHTNSDKTRNLYKKTFFKENLLSWFGSTLVAWVTPAAAVWAHFDGLKSLSHFELSASTYSFRTNYFTNTFFMSYFDWFWLTGYKHPYKWTSQVKEKILKRLKFEFC